MIHPFSYVALARQSLAPFEYTLPQYRDRLDFQNPIDPKHTNHERVALYLWERVNSCFADEPQPIRTIIHGITPAASTEQQILHGDILFEGRPYLDRDITLLSIIVQWFSTNCGRMFLEYIAYWTYVPTAHASNVAADFTYLGTTTVKFALQNS